MPKKDIKLPKNPADCADLLYRTRDERFALQKKVEGKEVLETALNEFFVNTMSKTSSGISGKVAHVQIKLKIKPVIEKPDKLFAYIKKTGAFDLIQRRLADKAVEERWEQGKTIPGVGKFNVKKVSCTKIK